MVIPLIFLLIISTLKIVCSIKEGKYIFTMDNRQRKGWKDLDIKEKFSYATALVAFTIGWCITVWGVYVPPVGEASTSVLAILGEALVYASGVFGLAQYFGSEHRKLRSDVRNRMNDMEAAMIERERIRNGQDIDDRV